MTAALLVELAFAAAWVGFALAVLNLT